MTLGEVVREETDFVSDSHRCAAWLFRPVRSSAGSLPIVVMGHGFAGERSFLLPEYAEAFAARGIAVLVFDYRHFGASEGDPRNLVDHRRQQNDWRAAIAHARSLADVDGTRVGLWGTSYSGGHVIQLAASCADVSAIVSQVPMVDAVRALRIGLPYLIRALGHGIVDHAASVVGRSPHYIPIVGPPGTFAALDQQGCQEGYRSLIPDDYDWANRVTARSLLRTLSFRPGKDAAAVACPALVVIAAHDQVIRAREMERVAAAIPNCTVRRYEVDHFGVYRGELFAEIRDLQAEFFVEHLRAESP